MPHDKLMKAIELYGTKVAPIVRKETAKPRRRRAGGLILPAACRYCRRNIGVAAHCCA